MTPEQYRDAIKSLVDQWHEDISDGNDWLASSCLDRMRELIEQMHTV